MKIPVTDIKVKRRINPRFEIDSDYVDELMAVDHWPAVIVTKEMTLIDGFHRLEASKRRGDEAIEADVRDISEEEALALAAKLNTIHGKRLTISELAQRIELLTKEQGWSQQRAAKYFNKSQPWISDHLSIAKNLSTTLINPLITLTYRSARELTKLSKDKQAAAYRIAQKMALQDRRLSPSYRLITKAVKKVQNEATLESNSDGENDDQERWLKLTTLWNFGSCDPRFGFQYPGRVPGQVVLNTLYYFTDPDDLIVDPFGGSGTTLDACNHLGRRCLAYDLEPARDDIVSHDISLGFPEEAQGCDLIFLDPPYWIQKRGKYTKKEGSFSEASLDEFNRKMEKLIRDCYDTVKPGGTIALLIQNTTELGIEIDRVGRVYADHVFDCYDSFIKTGLIPVQRINIPLTWEQFAGFDVKQAKDNKRLLGVVRDLLIMGKKVKGES